MTKIHKPAHARFARKALVTAVAVVCGSAAMAFEVTNDNPDLNVRWDNTIRYNLGQRMESPDSRILASPSYDESDAKFKQGDVVTNRVDLLSELDLNYKNQFGARVSASAWYDQAYDNHNVTSPAAGGAFPTSYVGNAYNATVSRYVNGPSAEFLDAFVWSSFNLGVVPVNVKLGRHAMAWGEGLLLGAHAVSYSQAPTDGQKAVSSPGIETKEVFLPVNQLSFKAQLTADLTLAGQYALEWSPTRAPNGGTYLMGADTVPNVDRLAVAPNTAFTNAAAVVPGQEGNWGLSARLNVDAIQSQVGFYYRRFNDYNPESGLQLNAPGQFRFVYPQDVKIIGMSLGRAIGPVAFGSEISLRQNGQLNSKSTWSNYSGMDIQNTGARGDTLHAIVNGIYLLPKTALWDTGSLIVEMAYSHLQSVTANQALYRGEGNRVATTPGGALACSKTGAAATVLGDKSDFCSTPDFYQIAVNFTPQWLGIMPSWDLDLPIALNYGISGVAPTASGGAEGVLSWSIGAKLTYMAKHEFSLRYSDLDAPSKYNTAGTTLAGGGASGSTIGATDRGWLVFTYKTSF